jgi:hypothetical protein
MRFNQSILENKPQSTLRLCLVLGALFFATACNSGIAGTPSRSLAFSDHSIASLHTGKINSNLPRQALQWYLPDVSVLFPIPNALPNPNAIHPQVTGSLGPLIPSSLISSLPLLEPHLSTDSQGNQLEIVSVRFDPPQVRLIFQIFKTVVESDGRTQVVAFDTAVHAFYNIGDVTNFMSELKSVNAEARQDLSIQDSLDVHPSLSRYGLNGNYGRALKALVLKWCGEQNLFKLTFMAATGEHLRWEFGGLNYNHGAISPLVIPKIDIAGVQKFINSSPSAGEFAGGGIDLKPNGQNEFDALVANSADAQATTPQKLELAHFTSVTLENPLLSITDNTDCASCHVAQMTKIWTEGRLPGAASETQNIYTNTKFNLSNAHPNKMRTDNLRSFGWFAGTPSVSQRTINDSAIVADRLSAIHQEN